MMTQPSRPVFWRFIFAALSILTLLASWGYFNRSQTLNVNLPDSSAWQALFILLGIFFILTLVGIGITYSKTGDRLWGWFESMEQTSKAARPFGILLATIGL